MPDVFTYDDIELGAVLYCTQVWQLYRLLRMDICP